MPSDNSADSELIDRLHKRDPAGLAAAYDRYGRDVYSLFLRITRDPTTAEDLVQELFLRLWNKAREFDAQRGALGVWLMSIARNMAIDHIRSAQVRFAAKQQSIEHLDQLCFSQNPVEPESRIDNMRAVKAALENLSFNERRALELAYFEGCSQSEIAARLKEPLGTVKSWIRAGMGRLRTALAEMKA